MAGEKGIATQDAAIRQLVALYGPHGWYVAEAGVRFLSTPLTDDEAVIARAAVGRRKFRIKQCFDNARRLVNGDKTKTLQYIEGFRAHGGFAHLHAWVTIHGKVIDPTVLPATSPAELLAAATQFGILAPTGPAIFGVFDGGTVYIGVPVPARVVRARKGDSALDDWENDFPLVREYERRAGKIWLRPSYREASDPSAVEDDGPDPSPEGG